MKSSLKEAPENKRLPFLLVLLYDSYLFTFVYQYSQFLCQDAWTVTMSTIQSGLSPHPTPTQV